MKIFVANASDATGERLVADLVRQERHARAFCLLLSIVAIPIMNAGCERAKGKEAAPASSSGPGSAGAAKGCTDL